MKSNICSSSKPELPTMEKNCFPLVLCTLTTAACYAESGGFADEAPTLCFRTEFNVTEFQGEAFASGM